jgi:hypothetical protein
MRHGRSEFWTKSHLLNVLFHWLDNNDIPDSEVLGSLNACSRANLEQAIQQAKERMGLRCPM